MGANCSNQHHRGQHYKSGNSSQTPRLQETLRKQREPYQVTLTTTDKESQKTVADMRPYQINKRCQDIRDGQPWSRSGPGPVQSVQDQQAWTDRTGPIVP